MVLCLPCDRHFSKLSDLEQHLQTSTRHTWCSRCQKAFNSPTSKEQHLQSSSRHHICLICSQRPDFTSEDELDDHYEKLHHYCRPCEEFFSSSAEVIRHDVAEHNLCLTCNKYFESSQNLRAHNSTHKERSMECYGCYDRFRSESAMLLHLESGSCVCGADDELITDLALECYQSSHYFNSYGDYQFRCPECDSQFNSMSALFQHVESDYCDESTESGSPLGKFLRFLKTRV